MEQACELLLQQSNIPSKSTADRARIVELIRCYGGSTADAVLDPSMQFFSDPSINGLVGYRIFAGCAIVFGDPICASYDKPALARAFHQFAEEQGKSIMYIAASQSFAHWAINEVCGALVEFGLEFILDPMSDPRKKTGTKGSLVRRKFRHAEKEGVKVFEYQKKDIELEKGIERVGELWLKARQGPQIHISNIYLFADCEGKRWFYAKQGDAIIGVVVLNRLQAHEGWLLNHLMVTPDAPGGTPETLVIAALEVLEKENCNFASIGLVTGSSLGEIRGLGKISTWIAYESFKFAKKIVHLDGLNTFWEKFHPRSEPSYLLFSRKRVGPRELLALKNALYGGNLK